MNRCFNASSIDKLVALERVDAGRTPIGVGGGAIFAGSTNASGDSNSILAEIDDDALAVGDRNFSANSVTGLVCRLLSRNLSAKLDNSVRSHGSRPVDQGSTADELLAARVDGLRFFCSPRRRRQWADIPMVLWRKPNSPLVILNVVLGVILFIFTFFFFLFRLLGTGTKVSSTGGAWASAST